MVRDLVPVKSLGRADVHLLLSARFPQHPLSLKQVSTLMDDAKRQARNSVDRLGGDLVAIVNKLTELKNADDGWVFHIKLNNKRQFEGLFWMSPNQVKLSRYGDVIINDIALLRNKYGIPLNVFVVIDQFFVTRNLAYAFHTSETANEHTWALDCLFGVLPLCLDRVFFSDFDTGLELAVSKRPTSEIAFHGRCLNHLDGNVIKKLAPVLGPLFQSFHEAFWAVYYSISPSAFEQGWTNLLQSYPAAQPYLQNELWPNRQRWAWAYIATRFTCGVRTSGRVEGENAINKLLGNSKTSAFDLATNLMKRAEDQDELETLRVRRVSLILVHSDLLTYLILCRLLVSITQARPMCSLHGHFSSYDPTVYHTLSRNPTSKWNSPCSTMQMW